MMSSKKTFPQKNLKKAAYAEIFVLCLSLLNQIVKFILIGKELSGVKGMLRQTEKLGATGPSERV